MKRAYLIGTICWLFNIMALAQHRPSTDLQQNELIGPVHMVKVEKAPKPAGDKESKNDARIMSELLVFDQAGNMIEETKYNEAGAFGSKRVFTRNKSGRLNDITMLNSDNSIAGKAVYSHDPAKNEIVETRGFVA